jgi:hypothetical protein
MERSCLSWQATAACYTWVKQDQDLQEFEYILCAKVEFISIRELSVRNMVPTLTSRKRRRLSLNGRC